MDWRQVSEKFGWNLLILLKPAIPMTSSTRGRKEFWQNTFWLKIRQVPYMEFNKVIEHKTRLCHTWTIKISKDEVLIGDVLTLVTVECSTLGERAVAVGPPWCTFGIWVFLLISFIFEGILSLSVFSFWREQIHNFKLLVIY